MKAICSKCQYRCHTSETMCGLGIDKRTIEEECSGFSPGDPPSMNIEVRNRWYWDANKRTEQLPKGYRNKIIHYSLKRTKKRKERYINLDLVIKELNSTHGSNTVRRVGGLVTKIILKKEIELDDSKRTTSYVDYLKELLGKDSIISTKVSRDYVDNSYIYIHLSISYKSDRNTLFRHKPVV